MSFMELQQKHGDWICIETHMEGLFCTPIEDCECSTLISFAEDVEKGLAFSNEIPDGLDDDMVHNNMILSTDTVWDAYILRNHHGARLSAPGYMDQTEWYVSETESEALEMLTLIHGNELGELEE